MEIKTLRKRENLIHVSHKMKTYFYYCSDSKFLESYHVCLSNSPCICLFYVLTDNIKDEHLLCRILNVIIYLSL